jgi:hypothetical protein
MVELPDDNGRIDRWDEGPLPRCRFGRPLGMVTSGPRLSLDDLEARGIPIDD